MRENQILYDRDDTGEFFQVYTRAFDERFFFEIVQRRGYQDFGAPNASVRLAAQTREGRPVTPPCPDSDTNPARKAPASRCSPNTDRAAQTRWTMDRSKIGLSPRKQTPP